MSRYLVTIADADPTLAAQAHAAIVAVPGVEKFEDFGRVLASLDPASAYVLGDALAFRGECASLSGVDATFAPTYTVGDEEDGEP